jgi:hypothetical protein
MATKAQRDHLWIQVVLGDIRPKLIKLGMYLPPNNMTVTVVDKEEMSRLLKRPVGHVTGLTVSHGWQYNMDHHIYVLDSLRPCSFKETLAHECGHVWLNDRNSYLIHQSRQEVEGFCNLVAYKVLLFEFSEEAKRVRKSMLENPDPIYGEGFRIMKQRADNEGWDNFLYRLS